MNRTVPQRGPLPRPPRLRPTWTTWMWLGFAVLFVVLTILGFYLAGSPHGAD